MLLAFGMLVLGVIFLVFGSDWLVKGASALATAMGVSSLVIGLTVVAFGTSAPEMAVSTMAAFAGNADIAVGNVVGSNIFNVLIILGISAVIVPLIVDRQLLRLDVPLMIAISGILLLLSLDGSINRLEGVVLFTGIILYTVGLIRMSRRETTKAAGETKPEKLTQKALWRAVLFVIAGLVFLVLGSQLLVKGAVFIASALGVSELIIGLTIVAAGTSMPELATSVMAAIKGERDIAIGNVIGSNIFNILAVLGLSGILSPEPITVAAAAIASDLPIMILAALLCFPFFFTGFQLDRREGAIFLLLYSIYIAFLVKSAQNDGTADVIKMTMFWMGGIIFVVSTAIVLFVKRQGEKS